MKILITVFVLLIIFLVGCTAGNKAGLKESIKMGYNSKKVKELLGPPMRIEKENNFRKWYYRTKENVKILFFKDDKLTIVYNRDL